MSNLTPRLRQVLDLMAEGKTVREMAEALGIAPNTVKIHRGALFAVFQTHDPVSTVLKAMQLGLLPQPGPPDSTRQGAD